LKNKKVIVLLIVLLFILAGGTFAYYYLNSSKKSQIVLNIPSENKTPNQLENQDINITPKEETNIPAEKSDDCIIGVSHH